MPAKTPIYLKTSPPKRGRKPRLRDVLSSDMISPPLGDFRHSAHIGPRGAADMFGDLSFLAGQYDLLPGPGRRLASRSAQVVGRPPGSPAPQPLKSAVSMPAFGEGPPQEPPPPKPPRLHLEELPASQHRSMSMSCAEGCLAGAPGLAFSGLTHYDQLPFSASLGASLGSWGLEYSAPAPPADPRAPPCSPSTSVPRSESLLALDLDLGPSILDDVLRIMEEYKRPGPKAP